VRLSQHSVVGVVVVYRDVIGNGLVIVVVVCCGCRCCYVMYLYIVDVAQKTAATILMWTKMVVAVFCATSRIDGRSFQFLPKIDGRIMEWKSIEQLHVGWCKLPFCYRKGKCSCCKMVLLLLTLYIYVVVSGCRRMLLLLLLGNWSFCDCCYLFSGISSVDAAEKTAATILVGTKMVAAVFCTTSIVDVVVCGAITIQQLDPFFKGNALRTAKFRIITSCTYLDYPKITTVNSNVLLADDASTCTIPFRFVNPRH
jgi:hypothetical protein